MAQEYSINLHTHTVLSPCADILMTPGNIIKKAREKKIDILAITDHNSAANVEVAMELVKDFPLHLIPGMEVETAEEVHLLCLFDSLEQILEWQDIVYHSLPDLKNDEEYFGYQLLVDCNDEFIGRVDKLLATAINLTVTQVVEKVIKIGGIVIPSHIEKAYGLITNLGLIPPELNLPVLEIFRTSTRDEIREKFPFLKNFSLIKNSDAHYLSEVKSFMQVILEEINVREILKSLDNKENIFS